jgi:ABC-type antimicrobial peptide transport system permease subunit
MFGTYLVRELTNRRKQTVLIAIGMALAIALVIIVNSVSTGVKDAQASVLASVYGVGTDITVSQTPEAPARGGGDGPPAFDFGAGDGQTADGSTSLARTRLVATRGTETFDAGALDTVLAVDNVQAATATLALENTSFSGEIPDFSQLGGADGGVPAGPPAGGADGAGGSSFSVDSFSVLGLDVAGEAVGPLTSVTLADGRTFTADDAGSDVAVLDSAYAASAGLAVGDTLSVGDTDFEIIGLVASGETESGSVGAATASNVYIPLDVAQSLADLDGQVSSVYVQASSSNAITQVQEDIEAALPDATVSTQADLASSVSGSLSTASSLVSSLGTWLSLLVLAAAFLIAILFTISGVTRRTREFGTLKAIGWSNRRIVGQVAGESLVQGVIGGIIGVAVGLLGVLIVNLVAPTLSASATVRPTTGFGGFGGAGGRGGAGGPGLPDAAAAATTDVTLHAPVTLSIILVAVGLAILGGILAGAIGGWRAARLRPAEALRSVA